MNDLQAKLLEILVVFDDFCRKHNLNYFLVGGSCLGAIRHKGFIPWDDDIDVGLPRPDYDRLMELAKEFDGTKYFLQNWKTDPNYTYNYAKLRDSSTTYIENFYVNHRINHGVWIDIFPIDGMSYDKTINPKKFKGKVLHTWFDVYLTYLYALKRKFHKKTWFKDFWLNLVAILFFWGNVGHYRNRLVDRRVRKIPFEKAELAGNLFGTNPKKEAMPRELFTETMDVEFEGKKVKVVRNADAYLTYLFNDYMKLPPVEKQVGHHHDKGLDLNVGYRDYMDKHRI